MAYCQWKLLKLWLFLYPKCSLFYSHTSSQVPRNEITRIETTKTLRTLQVSQNLKSLMFVLLSARWEREWKLPLPSSAQSSAVEKIRALSHDQSLLLTAGLPPYCQERGSFTCPPFYLHWCLASLSQAVLLLGPVLSNVALPSVTCQSHQSRPYHYDCSLGKTIYGIF